MASSGVQKAAPSPSGTLTNAFAVVCVVVVVLVRVVLCSNLSAAPECDIDFIAHPVKLERFRIGNVCKTVFEAGLN